MVEMVVCMYTARRENLYTFISEFVKIFTPHPVCILYAKMVECLD